VPEPDALNARAATIVAGIRQARAALDCLREMAPALHGGVQPRLETTLSEHEGVLSDGEGHVVAGVTWEALGNAEKALTPIFRDIHSAVQGASARALGLDGGLLAIADALIDELNLANEFKARMTVLSDREFYPSDQIAEMIRLRFPDVSVWVLPVVAHEFAHFLFRSLRVDDPAGGYIEPFLTMFGPRLDDRKWSRFEELSADVFATHVLGPAWALMAVELRFTHASRSATSTHPVDAARVEAMIRTLGRPIPGAAERLYGRIPERIHARWTALPGPLPDDDRTKEDLAVLDTRLPELWALLDKTVSQIRYRTYLKAASLAPRLEDGGWQNGLDDLSLADILVAAWLARTRQDATARTIADVEASTRDALVQRMGGVAGGGGGG
jgi:hypothetical protein